MDQAQQLRNIIKQQNMQQQHLARVITVTSGKGGVGKSNMSVNMAIQLSRLGKKVIILDADFGLANVEVMLGTRPKYNMADMIFGGKDIRDVICKGPENIGFISGGSGIKELSNLSKDQISGIINMMYGLDSLADIIIIDTGAGISDAVIDMVLASSEVLLVTTPEPTSITDAYALLKTINKTPGFNAENTRIRMIGNRTLNMSDGYDLYNKLNSVVERFLNMKMEYLGAVPFDVNLTKAVMRQQPVSIAYPNTPAVKSIKAMAKTLIDMEQSETKSVRTGLSGLFSKMFHNRKNKI
ncbi:MAG: MinD/ParA family protein [Clostridium sp.]|nr:MinD/ParA family protein [Clostridium sp.]